MLYRLVLTRFCKLVNSPGKVPSWGVAASIAYYVGHGITPYINYTYTDIDAKNLSSDTLTILFGL